MVSACSLGVAQATGIVSARVAAAAAPAAAIAGRGAESQSVRTPTAASRERAGNEHGGRYETAAPFAPEQIHDRREAGIEGGLLDQQGDPGQRTGPGET